MQDLPNPSQVMGEVMNVQEAVQKEVAMSVTKSPNRVVVNNELIISRELLVLVSPIIRDVLGSSPQLPGQAHLIIPDMETITMVRIRDILQNKVLGNHVVR